MSWVNATETSFFSKPVPPSLRIALPQRLRILFHAASCHATSLRQAQGMPGDVIYEAIRFLDAHTSVCYTDPTYHTLGLELMKLSKEEVRHIALLTRMGMTEEDIERMQNQLSNILENFEILEQVNTDDVSPTGHSVPLDTVLREDESRDSYSRDQVLANAPRCEEDLLRVKAVLE